jgi:hypothetical protein
MRNTRESFFYGNIFVLACAASVGLFGLYGFGMERWAFKVATPVHGSDAASNGEKGDPWTRRGQFGDMFGALNTVFSGLALAGVVTTLLMQRKDLQLQERASADARAASREQTDIALQTALLQALATQIETWRDLRSESGIGTETKKQLLREEQEMVVLLASHRERLEARLQQAATKPGSTVG